jgi:hypothetical protein
MASTDSRCNQQAEFIQEVSFEKCPLNVTAAFQQRCANLEVDFPAPNPIMESLSLIQRRQWSRMRKRIVDRNAAAESNSGWRDLTQIATVEVSSEDPHFPIESVFTGSGPGWRASKTGEQQIRLIFDEPVSVRRIQLRFDEPAIERTQEFSLRWSSAQGGPSAEIVRQQWNFSPHGSNTELEDYTVDLASLSVLELVIRPDISGRETVATLAAFLVA